MAEFDLCNRINIRLIFGGYNEVISVSSETGREAVNSRKVTSGCEPSFP